MCWSPTPKGTVGAIRRIFKRSSIISQRRRGIRKSVPRQSWETYHGSPCFHGDDGNVLFLKIAFRLLPGDFFKKHLIEYLLFLEPIVPQKREHYQRYAQNSRRLSLGLRGGTSRAPGGCEGHGGTWTTRSAQTSPCSPVTHTPTAQEVPSPSDMGKPPGVLG